MWVRRFRDGDVVIAGPLYPLSVSGGGAIRLQQTTLASEQQRTDRTVHTLTK